jgi:hypothetical protein
MSLVQSVRLWIRKGVKVWDLKWQTKEPMWWGFDWLSNNSKFNNCHFVGPKFANDDPTHCLVGGSLMVPKVQERPLGLKGLPCDHKTKQTLMLR